MAVAVRKEDTEDLESAGDYIALVLRNPTAAENTINGIRKRINKLQYFPENHEFTGIEKVQDRNHNFVFQLRYHFYPARIFGINM